MTNDSIEQRLVELGRSKARLELVNRQLISLSTVTGLDNLVLQILDILMQTVGAGNITIVFRLNNSWLLRDVYGTSRELKELDNPEVIEVLENGKAMRFMDSGNAVPYPGQSETIAVENWVFPLISHERKIGAVCMDGMQLTHGEIFAELKPFFVYAGLMLDNEISNYSQLAEAHQRLQDSETLYRTLFDQSPDGIVLWSVPGLKVLQFNATAHSMLEYSAEEFSRLTVKDLEVNQNSKLIPAIMEKVLQNREASFETKHRTKTDGIKSVFVSLKKLEIAGQPVILATHRNITELKKAEEERRRLEQQMLHAQKLESLGVLAGGIAHDFNNILGAVLGYTEMARDASPAGSVIAHDLDKVLKAGERATNLVKQILTFSREASIERVPLEPVHLVKEALKLLRPALPSTISISLCSQ